jgi:hypothetical protein
VAGLGALLVLMSWGHPIEGLALAAGLAIGSVNGFLFRRTLALPVSVWASSLARLGLLSVVGIGVALFLKPGAVWLLVLGIGAAQIVMSGIALKVALRR